MSDPACLLQRANGQPRQRISQFMHGGRIYWAKRPEAMPLRLRLQKGDGQRAFRREVARLTDFAALGAPVAIIAAQQEDLIVLQDMGPVLSGFLATCTPDRKHAAVAAAARALAALHAKGLSHGRPRLRDICWNGERIAFLDLEAGARRGAAPWRQALDLLIFLHSFFQAETDLGALAAQALESYHAADSAGIAPRARVIARRLRLLRPVLGPLVRRDRKRGKTNSEFIALSEVMDLLA